jgi:rfaE bifunctional protein kinase chain/domain
MDLRELKNQALAAIAMVQAYKKQPSVAVVGDMAVDRFVFGNVDRISPEAPVPVLLVEKSEDKAGCSANVVRNLSHLGQQVSFKTHIFGFVGDDEGSDRIQIILKETCTNASRHFEKDLQWVTPIKSRYIAGSQHQLLRVDHEHAAEKKRYAEKLPDQWRESLDQSSLIIAQDYSKGTLSENLLRDLVSLSRSKKIPLFVDPNRNTAPSWYRGATLLTPNIDEAERLCGFSLMRGQNDELVVKAAQKICKDYDLEGVLLTRGKHGMTGVFGKQGTEMVFTFPSFAREVYDVTGAGDTVIATLGLFFSYGVELPIAAYIANAAASVVVSKVGTAVASLDEISAVIEQIH